MRLLVVVLFSAVAAGQGFTSSAQTDSPKPQARGILREGESVTVPECTDAPASDTRRHLKRLLRLVEPPEGKTSGPWSAGIHPYIEPGFSVGGAGYGPGFASSAGLDFEQPRFMLLATGGYGFIRKTNDADQVPNEHGHTRSAEVEAFLRLGRNFAGLGAQWGETADTPYRKYSWAPEIAAGHDFGGVARIVGSYFRSRREYTDYPGPAQFTPGPGQPAYSDYCICGNGVSGGDVQLWVPLAVRKHVILHYDVSIIHFHETVTDPYDTPLTALQDAKRSFSGGSTFGVQFRF